MHSFLFPEDISPVLPRTNNLHKSALELNNSKTPPVPSRKPPMAPQAPISQSLPPPQPSHAPPPPPLTKDKSLVSVTELSVPTQRIEPNLQRTKSKRSCRQAIGFSQLKDRREAKAVSHAEKIASRPEVVLPPLSPVVDEEFWRTGRYPSSPQGFTMAHVPF
jgi:hypothetical protein